MARRKRSAPPVSPAPPASPVQIVLTEEDLAAVIRETVRGIVPPEAAPSAEAPAVPFAVPAPVPPPPAPVPPPVDRAWSLGVRSPGAVGDAIRMILDATTLDRGKRMKIPGE